jgi:hypothetical protein
VKTTGALMVVLTMIGVNAADPAYSKRFALSSDVELRFVAATERYQLFITPLCDGESVMAYNRARAERDADFYRSIARTPLEAAYQRAAKAFSELEARTVRHCFGPMPPFQVASEAKDPKVEREAALASHFRGGDEAFAALVSIRDEAMGHKGK